MSDPIHSRPLSASGRENFDRIFKKAPLTPGTIREYHSDCCGEKVVKYVGEESYRCRLCGLPCTIILTKIN